MEADVILVLNGGSSSIKVVLFEAGILLKQRSSGVIERTGATDPVLRLGDR